MQYMDLKEFRTLGYLHEANRLFFHPLGLALTLVLDDEQKEPYLEVQDAREDKEGFLFNQSLIDDEKIKLVESERVKRIQARFDTGECDSNGIQERRIDNV